MKPLFETSGRNVQFSFCKHRSKTRCRLPRLQRYWLILDTTTILSTLYCLSRKTVPNKKQKKCGLYFSNEPRMQWWLAYLLLFIGKSRKQFQINFYHISNFFFRWSDFQVSFWNIAEQWVPQDWGSKRFSDLSCYKFRNLSANRSP